MNILFGLFVLAILVLGLINRKKSKKQWLKEERYEESGAWIDKRAGERGTWGSLDEEMDNARKHVAKAGRVTALADVVRNYAFEQYPGFHDLKDGQIKKFSVFVRSQAAQMIAVFEQIKHGETPEPVRASYSNNDQVTALKKQILDFAYQHYPSLLDLDIPTIRQLDELAGAWAGELLGRIGLTSDQDPPA